MFTVAILQRATAKPLNIIAHEKGSIIMRNPKLGILSLPYKGQLIERRFPIFSRSFLGCGPLRGGGGGGPRQIFLEDQI